MPPIEGMLGFLGLGEWWIETFSADERKYIETVFQPLGSTANSRPLTIGRIAASSQTPAKLLGALIGWFRMTPLDERMTRSLADKLWEVIDAEPSVLDRHFGYQALLQWSYRRRAGDPTALAAAVTACERQIAILEKTAAAMQQEGFGAQLPHHRGFEQLAVIREKGGDFEGAIRLAEQAGREGWNGDWVNRINRCRKKAARESQE